jgi:hypothetical protein
VVRPTLGSSIAIAKAEAGRGRRLGRGEWAKLAQAMQTKYVAKV